MFLVRICLNYLLMYKVFLLIFFIEYFFDIFFFKEFWEDCEGVNGKFCWGVVGFNIFVIDNKVSIFSY